MPGFSLFCGECSLYPTSLYPTEQLSEPSGGRYWSEGQPVKVLVSFQRCFPDRWTAPPGAPEIYKKNVPKHILIIDTCPRGKFVLFLFAGILFCFRGSLWYICLWEIKVDTLNTVFIQGFDNKFHTIAGLDLISQFRKAVQILYNKTTQ